MQDIIFPISDNWWVEGDKAYFCGIVLNAVFCVDMISQKCDLIAWMPESNIMNFRQNPYCIKRGDQIFCLPGTGQCVWCYDMQQRVWEKIEISHDEQLYFYNKTFYRDANGVIWLSEYETGKVLQINLEKKALEKIHYFPTRCRHIFDVYGEYIFIQNRLYCIVENTIKCIDLDNDELITYKIPEAKANLFTICYDGTNFWLSGYCKEIYVWNPEKGMIKVITDFPKQFGFYHFRTKDEYLDIDCNSYYKVDDPFFYESVILGKYIWFISSQSSSILYIDRETYKVNLIDIKEEQETIDSIKREFACKYLFEYIRAERYIGIYSTKNQWIFEIDTVELCVKKKNYQLSNGAVTKIMKAIEDDNFQRILEEDIRKHNQRIILREGKDRERILYAELIKRSVERDTKDSLGIGELIYSTLE